MTGPDDAQIKRFVDGFAVPSKMQERPGRDGDPQMAALTQFLQTISRSLDHDDVILDIGSGNAMLVEAMLHVWPAETGLPWYGAVDRDKELDGLRLEHRVHNHSRKIRFSDFFLGRLPFPADKLKVAILRNFLHEVDIATTAQVLNALRHTLPGGSTVYIQDMVLLPEGERESAGWLPHILGQLVIATGFDSTLPSIQRSHSGNEWFALTLTSRRDDPLLSLREVTRLVSDARKSQLVARYNRLAELGKESMSDTAREYLQIAAEAVSIGTQLNNVNDGQVDESTFPVVAGIPIIPPTTSFEYADEIATRQSPRSGLRAVLSSKHQIDLPRLFDSTHSRLWFAGYSERLLFVLSRVRASLADAVRRGVELRILMVDPRSAAALARSYSEAYDAPEDLFRNIRDTHEYFEMFKRDLSISTGGRINDRCELRFSAGQVSSSFFFADDTCICSLYSANLAGGDGTAFVFGPSVVQPNGYFQILLREFQVAWAGSSASPVPLHDTSDGEG